MDQEPECAECGGTVAPDGHCWDCGADQEDFHAHGELTVAGGAGVTDRGRRRRVNADALALTEVGPWRIGVVCDGVSMSPRPERAARLAADVGARVLTERLSAGEVPETALTDSLHIAGRAVTALAGPEPTAPACTYVAGVVGPSGLWVTWIGDSRAHWLPEHGLGLPLTRDDTADSGAISAWLGADADLPEPRTRSLVPGVPGTLLLSTDGLTRYLPDADALRDAMRASEPLRGARALVDHALSAGGHDNVTALLLRIPAPPTENSL